MVTYLVAGAAVLLALAVVPRDYLQTRLGEPGVQHRAAASHTRATVRLPA